MSLKDLIHDLYNRDSVPTTADDSAGDYLEPEPDPLDKMEKRIEALEKKAAALMIAAGMTEE